MPLLSLLASDEKQHVEALEGTIKKLGAKPVAMPTLLVVVRLCIQFAPRRMPAFAKAKIGKGEPLGFAPKLCPQAQSDPFSDKVNYYLGATVAQPTFFRLGRIDEHAFHVPSFFGHGALGARLRPSRHGVVNL